MIRRFEGRRRTAGRLQEVLLSLDRSLVSLNRPSALSQYYDGHLMYDWSDGDTLGYSRFAPGQPDYRNQNEECVETNYYRE